MEVVLMILSAFFIVIFSIRSFIYIHLEKSNSYSKYPMLNLDYGIFTYFDKKVKPHQLKLKKLCNQLLVISGYLFLIILILMFINAFIEKDSLS